MFKKIISESLVQSDDKNNIQKVVFKFTKIRLSGLKFIFSLSNIAEIIACFYFFLCLPSSNVSFPLSTFIFVPMFSLVREKRDIGQRIVLLENRLDGVMVQFNATLAQNTSVRKEIDHLVKKIRNLIFTLKLKK